MSQVWFTADLHLGHANISLYCRRPWLRPEDVGSDDKWVSQEAKNACAHRGNAELIRRWNSRVQDGDTVYVLGDFCCRGNERGESGVRTKAAEWLAELHGNKVLILGNHDRNNSLPRGLSHAVMEAGGRRLLLVHRPAVVPHVVCAFDRWDVCLCGHIHTAWKEAKLGGALFINVGVDARKFAPVSLSEVLGVAERLEHGNS